MINFAIRVIDCHVVYRKKNINEFLILKRSPDKIYPGIWQCITGKIEPNEKPIETAIRELKEETNLKPITKWTIDYVNQFYEAQSNRMNLAPVFGVEVNSKNILLSDEHVDFKWCEIDTAKNLITWTQQKNGLQAFHDMLTYQKEKLFFSLIK